MSELIQKTTGHGVRWKLLTEASALALLGYVATTHLAKAEDSDRPTVWIEVGGQLSRLQNSQEIYAPSFVDLTPSDLSPPQTAGRPPRYGIDEGVSITFQPEISNWHFSAAVRYGRASSNKQMHDQTNPSSFVKYHITKKGKKIYNMVAPSVARFTDADAKLREAHTIVDFAAGKDVGLGLFGPHDTSSLNLGVRFAQFQSKSRIALRENPDAHFSTRTFVGRFNGWFELTANEAFHSYAGLLIAERSFRGVGPSVSWSSSARLVGNADDGELNLDFGLNGAVLFGRQKTETHHQTTGLYHSPGIARTAGSQRMVDNTRREIVYQQATDPTRSHSVIVPDIGAFVGFSMKYPGAKVSFGYKADFFFGAMDGGIDIRRTEDVGFHGPYASVSIGLGG